MIKVKRLEQHVAEFGVADAALTVLHAGAHAFLGHHLVDGKMLADVTQKIEIRNARRPRGIVHEPGGIRLGIKIKDALQLLFDAGDIVFEQVAGEQLAFARLAARIPNRAGCAASERNGMMSGQLKPAQHELPHQMSNMQAVGRRVKTAVKRDGRGNFFGQFRRIGAIGQEAAPFQFFQDVHRREIKLPDRECQFPFRGIQTVEKSFNHRWTGKCH